MIINVVIEGSDWKAEDMELIFTDEDFVLCKSTEVPNLLVELGIYKSTSQARSAGRIGPVPTGFTESFKASKKRTLCIWNPKD